MSAFSVLLLIAIELVCIADGSPTPRDDGSDIPDDNINAVVISQPDAGSIAQQTGALPPVSHENTFDQPLIAGTRAIS